MAKTSLKRNEWSSSEEVRTLISRKLQMRQREQVGRFVAATQLAHSNLEKEFLSLIGTSKIAKAFTSVPIATFKEIVAEVTEMTRNWPGIVWESVTWILDKAQLAPYDPGELNAIVDEFAWSKGQRPFTYEYLAEDRFREMFYQLIGRCGMQRAYLQRKGVFDKEFDFVAAAAAAGILNTARWAREEIAVTIDEYVIQQEPSKVHLAEAVFPCSSRSAFEVVSPVPAVSHQCEVFREMKNLTSDELKILFVGDQAESGLAANNMLEISARKDSRRIALSELDLVNRHTGNLNSQGAVLLGMALRMSPPYNQANAKKISRLREIIRESFGVKDDPFDRSSEFGWLPRFEIADNRGLADERAKQRARRRTMSYDEGNDYTAQSNGIRNSGHSFEREEDDADDWLKRNYY